MSSKTMPSNPLRTENTGRKLRSASWRGALSCAFLLACVFILSSCLAGLQGTASSPSLPKVETSPPANYTKGAPAYAMRFHTMSSFVPGAGGGFGGAVAGLMGVSEDMRTVSLRMISHPAPSDGASPKAYHMIPPSMNMGEYLPLLPPVKEATADTRSPGTEPSKPEQAEPSKPERVVIKIYWGCGENVRQKQPRVIDTSKMTGHSMPASMPSSMPAPGGGGRVSAGSVGLEGVKPGWVEALWPNRDDSRQVPSSASLVGGHFIHGNFLPHIRFTMDAQHDIMAKLTLSAEKTSLKEAIPVTWKKLPTAIGYHLMAFAYSDARKEMVIWTSSENPDINVGGEFLDAQTVKKHIASKIILPADRERCVIPKGIFDGMDVVMVSGTAWGDDYWASEPPRPANPPKNWKPDWVVKGQFMSTGVLLLGVNAPAGNEGEASGDTNMGNMLRGFFK